MYESVLISGGTTMFPGFPTRLQNDLIKLYKTNILKGGKKYRDANIKIKVIVSYFLHKPLSNFFLQGSSNEKVQCIHRWCSSCQKNDEYS